MSTISEQTVGELVAENPAAARVFEELGIDYCCHGGRTLEEASLSAGLAPQQVLDSMAAQARSESVEAPEDWRTAPLAGLVAHIRDTHHQYTRTALARLQPLFERVCSVHGKNHPELDGMRSTFGGLAGELFTHLMKEEMVLFPHIVRLEGAVLGKATVVPAPFGSVRNPVAMMVREHDGAGDALTQMRAASHGYSVPPDACASFHALYQGLIALEADLHRHIHLENNILFPRAVEMEQRS